MQKKIYFKEFNNIENLKSSYYDEDYFCSDNKLKNIIKKLFKINKNLIGSEIAENFILNNLNKFKKPKLVNISTALNYFYYIKLLLDKECYSYIEAIDFLIDNFYKFPDDILADDNFSEDIFGLDNIYNNSDKQPLNIYKREFRHALIVGALIPNFSRFRKIDHDKNLFSDVEKNLNEKSLNNKYLFYPIKLDFDKNILIEIVKDIVNLIFEINYKTIDFIINNDKYIMDNDLYDKYLKIYLESYYDKRKLDIIKNCNIDLINNNFDSLVNFISEFIIMKIFDEKFIKKNKLLVSKKVDALLEKYDYEDDIRKDYKKYFETFKDKNSGDVSLFLTNSFYLIRKNEHSSKPYLDKIDFKTTEKEANYIHKINGNYDVDKFLFVYNANNTTFFNDGLNLYSRSSIIKLIAKFFDHRVNDQSNECSSSEKKYININLNSLGNMNNFDITQFLKNKINKIFSSDECLYYDYYVTENNEITDFKSPFFYLDLSKMISYCIDIYNNNHSYNHFNWLYLDRVLLISQIANLSLFINRGYKKDKFKNLNFVELIGYKKAAYILTHGNDKKNFCFDSFSFQLLYLTEVYTYLRSLWYSFTLNESLCGDNFKNTSFDKKDKKYLNMILSKIKNVINEDLKIKKQLAIEPRKYDPINYISYNIYDGIENTIADIKRIIKDNDFQGFFTNTPYISKIFLNRNSSIFINSISNGSYCDISDLFRFSENKDLMYNILFNTLSSSCLNMDDLYILDDFIEFYFKNKDVVLDYKNITFSPKIKEFIELFNILLKYYPNLQHTSTYNYGNLFYKLFYKLDFSFNVDRKLEKTYNDISNVLKSVNNKNMRIIIY